MIERLGLQSNCFLPENLKHHSWFGSVGDSFKLQLLSVFRDNFVIFFFCVVFMELPFYFLNQFWAFLKYSRVLKMHIKSIFMFWNTYILIRITHFYPYLNHLSFFHCHLLLNLPLQAFIHFHFTHGYILTLATMNTAFLAFLYAILTKDMFTCG